VVAKADETIAVSIDTVEWGQARLLLKATETSA
jgi:hypothetical protein